MKVLVIDELANTYSHGGSPGNRLVSSLSSYGIEAKHVCIEPRHKLLLSILKKTPMLREIFLIPFISKNLISRVESEADLLHISNTTTLLLKKPKKPTVATVHCCFSRQIDLFRNQLPFKYRFLFNRLSLKLFQNLEKHSLENADIIIAPRTDLFEFITKNLGISENKVRLVYVGVDVEKFCPTPRAEKKDIDVLFVGRGTVTKGFDILLEASRLIKGNITVVASRMSKNYRNKLKRLKNIKVINGTSYSSIQDYYKRSKVFVMPSLSEVCPQVTLEAMACAVPIVCTRQGAGDFVRDGIEGIVVRDRDYYSLANAVNKLLAQPLMAQRMGVNCRQRVMAPFSWSKTIDDLVAIYNEIQRKQCDAKGS